MTHLILTPIRFENGIWQGHLQADTEPRVEVRYLGETLDDVQVSASEGGWDLTIPVPVAALSDGVHCFVIADAASSEKLGDFTIIAGTPAADDLRAEVELLRAELDMLKRAFRRAHSVTE
ncbi:hypothetical protein [Ruegeria arenilitoris]|uniref:hypothetical protein n=1 Tax=Ruegeria arenilitoris TaxID=1173585 RepID=UPI001481C47B|nr:hypothetical protein [Ruegeria arenilitoris]